MADIREPDAVPYADLADRLKEVPQRVVPFLGAGVPLSGRTGDARSAEAAVDEAADRAAADALLAASGLKQPTARALLEWASHVAQRLERADDKRDAVAVDILERLTSAATAPSASELAQLFAERAPYDPFKVLGESVARRVPRPTLPRDCNVTEVLRACFGRIGLDAPVGSLSSIAALYERGNNRGALLENLARVLRDKRTPTVTHRMIARIATHHVARGVARERGTAGDYLIITTNYDRLMEIALEDEHVPHLIVTTRRSDGKVIAVASRDVRDPVLQAELAQKKEEFPRDFAPQRSEPVVVLYKMHGSIGDGALAEDSVVISDNDYVDCLTWMERSERMIPALVGDALHSCAFLFLGYSLNDWNVRSFFRVAIKKRAGRTRSPDYAVLNRFTDFDRVFFDDNGVTILHTDLGDFATGLLRRLPVEYQLAT